MENRHFSSRDLLPEEETSFTVEAELGPAWWECGGREGVLKPSVVGKQFTSKLILEFIETSDLRGEDLECDAAALCECHWEVEPTVLSRHCFHVLDGGRAPL